MKKKILFKFKVYYEDTDAGGVVYYANYLKYIERARTELIHKFNLSHKILKEKYNTIIVVRSCDIQYKTYGFFEDELIVSTKLIKYSSLAFTLEQIIKRNKELIVSTKIQLVTVNSKGKLCNIPSILLNHFKKI